MNMVARICLAAAVTGCGDAPGVRTGGDVQVRIRATTAQFQHADGLSGQTAADARGGIRSLTLLRNGTDPNPLRVFDHGEGQVEVSFNEGGNTHVATLESRHLVAGHFRLARLVQTHSRYTLAATYHDGQRAEPGVLNDLLVMTDHVFVDGAWAQAGTFRFTFSGASGEATSTGMDHPVPPYSTTAGAWATFEDGEWAVYFPIDLVVHPAQWVAKDLVVTVNMDHAFRWQDRSGEGHVVGTFDVTGSAWEPVVRFGGNRFEVTLEPSPGSP
jgi:hypothetical protein